MSREKSKPFLHVRDDGPVSDDRHLLHLDPGHDLQAGHAGALPPDWRQEEAVVVELLVRVGRQPSLHQPSELTDVEPSLAQPGEDSCREKR